MATRHAGRAALIFLASDFHWPLAPLDRVLDMLSHAYVVPIVVWDAAEVEPPAQAGLVPLRDAESRAQRTLWMRPTLRARWRDRVQARREELQAFFARRALRPFFMMREFDPEAMSRYFLEAASQ